MMTARIWHGLTPVSKGDAYVDYLMKSGIRAYRSTEGVAACTYFAETEGASLTSS